MAALQRRDDAGHDDHVELVDYLPLVERWWPAAASLPVNFARGQDHDVVLLGDETVVRFARHPAAVATQPREARLLRLLDGVLEVALPRVLDERTGPGPGEAFLVQRRLHGNRLRESTAVALGPMAFRYASPIADLLQALAAVPLTPALCDELAPALDWSAFAARVEQLLPRMSAAGRERAQAEVAAVVAVRPPAPAVLVHGDLGGNLLWDPDERRPTGLLDWTFAHPGDQAYDLATLAAVSGWELAETVDALLPESLLERARAYAGTFALQEALHGVDVDDEAAVGRGLAVYVAP